MGSTGLCLQGLTKDLSATFGGGTGGWETGLGLEGPPLRGGVGWGLRTGEFLVGFPGGTFGFGEFNAGLFNGKDGFVLLIIACLLPGTTGLVPLTNGLGLAPPSDGFAPPIFGNSGCLAVGCVSLLVRSEVERDFLDFSEGSKWGALRGVPGFVTWVGEVSVCNVTSCLFEILFRSSWLIS